MSKIQDLVNNIDALSLSELGELKSGLANRFDIDLSMLNNSVQPSTTTLAPAIQEQTEFNVILNDSGSNKIGVIKIVREITGLPLKESKDIVDSLPKMIKESISKDDAQVIIQKFVAAGAIAILE